MWQLSPNHFLVRQFSLPGHLIVCPDRRVRLALPSTLNPVVKQRKSISNPARYGAADHCTRPSSRFVKWLQATHLTGSLPLNSMNRSELSARSLAGDPNPSNFDSHRPRFVEVKAVERVREVVRVALALDLAVRDDVDPSVLHVPHGEPRRVVLRLDAPPATPRPRARARARERAAEASRRASRGRSASPAGGSCRSRSSREGASVERYEHEDTDQPGVSRSRRGARARPDRRPHGPARRSPSTSTCS